MLEVKSVSIAEDMAGVSHFQIQMGQQWEKSLAMLISPRRFFLLPTWIRAQGTLTPERYSSGWGALQLRLLGAVSIGGILWVAYYDAHPVTRRQHPGGRKGLLSLP